MDFKLSDEQRMLDETVSRLVRDEYDFESRRKLLERPEGYSPELWQAYAELGLLGIPFAEENGGFAGGGVELLVVMQAFGRGLVLEPYLATVVLGGGLIEQLGSAEQRESLLGAVIGGELKLALAYLEPAGRYEPLHVTTRAERTGAGWRLSGAKAVVLHGDSADKLLITARTGGADTDRDGISLFLVDADAPGVEIRGYRTIDGLRAAELRLQDVELTAEALLGEAGQAADALELALARGQAALCAEAVGAMEQAVELTVEYLKQRQQFGVPIGRFQALQHKAVDMRIELEQARSMAILAAASLELPAAERDRRVSAAKVVIGNAGRFISEQAIQLHGGMGMTEEAAVSHFAKRLVMIDHYLGDADHHLARYSANLSAA